MHVHALKAFLPALLLVLVAGCTAYPYGYQSYGYNTAYAPSYGGGYYAYSPGYYQPGYGLGFSYFGDGGYPNRDYRYHHHHRRFFGKFDTHHHRRFFDGVHDHDRLGVAGNQRRMFQTPRPQAREFRGNRSGWWQPKR